MEPGRRSSPLARIAGRAGVPHAPTHCPSSRHGRGTGVTLVQPMGCQSSGTPRRWHGRGAPPLQPQLRHKTRQDQRGAGGPRGRDFPAAAAERDAKSEGCQRRRMPKPGPRRSERDGDPRACRKGAVPALRAGRAQPPRHCAAGSARAGRSRLASAVGQLLEPPCRVAWVRWQDLALPPRSPPPLLPRSLSPRLLAGHRPPWDLPSLHVPLWTALARLLFTETQCVSGLGGHILLVVLACHHPLSTHHPTPQGLMAAPNNVPRSGRGSSPQV